MESADKHGTGISGTVQKYIKANIEWHFCRICEVGYSQPFYHCDSCGSHYQAYYKNCPSCGTSRDNMTKSVPEKTIEGLIDCKYGIKLSIKECNSMGYHAKKHSLCHGCKQKTGEEY